MPQSHVKDRILFRPFRAGTWLLGVVPGRCPGLICDCPFGATTQRAQLVKNLRGRLVWDPRVRQDGDMVSPSRARIDVAPSGIPPRRGNNISAQGNALGTGIPRKGMPCKGATSLGCCDVAVARKRPHSVSPFQGRDVAAGRVPKGVALGVICDCPFGGDDLRKAATSELGRSVWDLACRMRTGNPLAEKRRLVCRT